MTQIDFYTHVDNKLGLACQLVGKAYAQRARVFVYAPDASTCESLDRMLWTTPAIGFVPHCRDGDALAADTPILIGHDTATPPHDEILLNLRGEWPTFFARFQRLIEIVSLDEADRLAARERFKFYRDRGYQIQTHNLSELAARA